MATTELSAHAPATNDSFVLQKQTAAIKKWLVRLEAGGNVVAATVVITVMRVVY